MFDWIKARKLRKRAYSIPKSIIVWIKETHKPLNCIYCCRYRCSKLFFLCLVWKKNENVRNEKALWIVYAMEYGCEHFSSIVYYYFKNQIYNKCYRWLNTRAISMKQCKFVRYKWIQVCELAMYTTCDVFCVVIYAINLGLCYYLIGLVSTSKIMLNRESE